MSKLEYYSPKGQSEVVRGSDTRLNVSSRSDTRAFYISRDSEQGYVLHIQDAAADAGDIIAYLKNTSSSLSIFIRRIEVKAENAAKWVVAYGDETAATGTEVTPINLNKKSSNAASVSAFGNGAVGGVTATQTVASLRHAANGSSMEDFQDMMILGQNDNIIVEYDVGTTGLAEVDIYFYMDTLD